MASSKPTTISRLGTAVKKIESPLAKYNSAGQLTCIVCNIVRYSIGNMRSIVVMSGFSVYQVVKSEAVWTAHIHGRQHHDRVAALKKPKEEFSKPQIPIKRKADDVGSKSFTPSPSKKGVPADFFDSPKAPAKPIKSILKNSAKQLQPTATQTTQSTKTENEMETDEIQPQSASRNDVIDDNKTAAQAQGSTSVSTGSLLPEGFFDDPKLDAKV